MKNQKSVGRQACGVEGIMIIWVIFFLLYSFLYTYAEEIED